MGAFVGTFGVNLFIQACSIVQGVIVARLLGPLGRGEYAAVILWPSLFAAVSILGSHFSISRLAAKGIETGPLFRSALLTGIATATLGATACYFAIPFLMPANERHLVPLARLFVLVIPLNHLAYNFIAVEQGIGSFRLYNFYRAALNPVYVCILGIFCFAGISSVKPFVVALLIANLAVSSLAILVSFRRHKIFGRIYPPLSILRQSLHFALAGIADAFYQQADKAILLWLLGVENLGIYAVALSASMAVSSLTSATGVISFVMAAQESHAEGFEGIFKIFRMSMLLWLFFGGMIAIIMPWILPLVYGPNFVSGVIPAQILMVGSAAAGLSTQLELAMRGQGRAFVGLEGRLVGLVIMAGLGVVLSKHWGLLGICAAFVIGQLSCLMIIVRRALNHYRIPWDSSYLLPGKNDLISSFIALQRILPFKRSEI